ncbi:MAG: acyltransferase [Bacteroidetes bacterium]|jgi:N-carbamoylputrescine amidase|nr:acyltransferase [Bacteroidota bacterium]
MNKPFQLSLIQTYAGMDKNENLERTEEFIRRAASEGGQVICLQELFHMPYFCSSVDQANFAFAEPIPGPTVNRLAKLAKNLSVVLMVPLFERAAAGIYFNSMAAIDADGSLLGTYRKMHIPEDPGFHEKYYFTPGDLGYKVFKTAYGSIGTLICWDQWFPEAARIAALKGADLLIYPTAIGTLYAEGEEDKKRFMDSWKIIQRSHAIANGCYVASINRTGKEHKSEFWGNSFIAGPFGELLAEAGESPGIVSSRIDPSSIDPQRLEWPFFRDRRIESYKPILSRTGLSGEQ